MKMSDLMMRAEDIETEHFTPEEQAILKRSQYSDSLNRIAVKLSQMGRQHQELKMQFMGEKHD